MIFALIAPLLWQEAAPQSPATADPARARFDAAVAHWRKGAALDTAFHFRVEYPAQDGMEAQTFLGDVEVHVARPLHGTLKFHQEDLSMSYLADGAKVYEVDDSSHSYMEAGDSLQDLPFFDAFAPLLLWADPKAAAPKTIELVQDPARPGAQGLKLQIEESTQTLWLNASDEVLAATWVQDEQAPPVEISFSRWSTPESVDLAQYRAKLPEGYVVMEAPEAMDFESGLLAVGATAPEVHMTDLDGKPLALSELRGRTVLLNFWFRH